ncbi:MAG TPA: gluconate 2-dehydrogenase subunit 3 family protein [Bryobacteraceae bacterium]
MSADRYHPIPVECPTDYIRPRTGSRQPLFFTSAEFPAVLRLIQLMLGEIKDDARVSQEVAEWFDLYLASAEPVHEAEMHLDPLHHALAAAFYGSAATQTGAKARPAAIGRQGIQWVLHASRTRYSKEFLSLDPEQQTAILHSISDETPGQPESSGTRFFTLLKAETIRGFYTSRIGLQELNFKGNAFYAHSPGCHSK